MTPAGMDRELVRTATRDATRLLVLLRAELLEEHRSAVRAIVVLREQFLARTVPESETELAVGLASLPEGPPADFHRRGKVIGQNLVARRLREFTEAAGPLAEQEYLRAIGHMRARAIRIADAVHWHAPSLAEGLRHVSPTWIEPGTSIRENPVWLQPPPLQWARDHFEGEERARRRIARKLTASLRDRLSMQCLGVERDLGRRLAWSRESLGKELTRVLRQSVSLEHTTFPGHTDAP